MQSHRWKILTGIAVVFFVLTCIEVMTIGNGPKEEVEAYKKLLIAKGEKLEISELVPPSIPPEQNGAVIVNRALGMLTADDQIYSNSIPPMLMIAPGKAIVCFEQPDVRELNFTNSWENELAVVANDQPMNDLLMQAMNYPTIDFQLNCEDWPPTGKFPLFRVEYRLSTEAMCKLHQGDAASAGTDISAILALVKGLDDERFEEFQRIRVRMTWLAADTTWELLQSSNVNDGELGRLQSSWEGPEFIHAMENAVSMQRAKLESEIIKMRDSREYFNKETEVTDEDVDWSDSWRDAVDGLLYKARLAGAKSMYRASWTYSDELRMLKEYEIPVQVLRAAETNQFFFPAYNEMTNEPSAYKTDEPDDWLAKWDDADLRHMFSEGSIQEDEVSWTMEAEATRRLAVTAIALKRYQLKHGDYPSSLTNLMPQFVSSVPQDPIDGRPLRYRRMTDGTFVLYSIGENGKDDGGDASLTAKTFHDMPPRFTTPDALDWVWPQPATPAEVQAFYAHMTGP